MVLILITVLDRQRRADLWLQGHPGLQSQVPGQPELYKETLFWKQTSKCNNLLGVVVHSFGASTQQAEVDASLCVQGQAGLQRKPQGEGLQQNKKDVKI